METETKHNYFNILSLDVANHLGWCIYDNEKKAVTHVGSFTLEQTKKQPLNECQYLGEQINEMIKKYNINYILNEDIHFSDKTKSAFKKLASYRGVMYYIAALNGIPVKDINPEYESRPKVFAQDWYRIKKKKGVELKKAIVDKVKFAGFKVANDDEADSILNLWGFLRHFDKLARIKPAENIRYHHNK